MATSPMIFSIGAIAGFLKGLGIGGFGVIIAGSGLIAGSDFKYSLTVMLLAELAVSVPALATYAILKGVLIDMQLLASLTLGGVAGAFVASRLMAPKRYALLRDLMAIYASIVGSYLLLSAWW